MQLFREGVIGSRGIAIGRALLFKKEDININKEKIDEKNKENEIKKIKKAINDYIKELENAEVDSEAQKGVVEAHIGMLKDPFLIQTIENQIKDKNLNAELALVEGIGEMIEILSNLEDDYLSERAMDYKDLERNILYKLKGIKPKTLSDVPENSIVFSKELTPSDTNSMDKKNIKGLVVDLGGKTDHTSIISQTLGIPALVSMKNVSEEIEDGMMVILDAIEGKLFIEPGEKLINKYEEKIELRDQESKEYYNNRLKPAITKDGHQVEVACNIGNVSDLNLGLIYGAEGVGLFRTEFLYMENDDFPTEEEQFKSYKEAAELLDGKPLIIRTLDIGGDKSLPYYDFPKEDNPFLGWRALRISFDMPEVFETQLRAILRASNFSKIRILLPMVISVEEVKEVKRIIEDIKNDLRKEEIPFDEDIEIGIMVETPASVIIADELIKHVDYFSIGTNDLTQYILAVDRGNEIISNLYSNYHPAVLRAIKHVIDVSHKAGKWTGMCGGFASDVKATKLLLGMGLDEFSAVPTNIPNIKNTIRNTTFEEAKEHAEKVLSLGTREEIGKYLELN